MITGSGPMTGEGCSNPLAEPMYLIIGGFVLALPIIIVILWAPVTFAATPKQRIIMMTVGLAGAILSGFTFMVGTQPARPQTLLDRYYVGFAILSMAVGAAVAIGLCVVVTRVVMSRKTRKNID